MLYRQRFNTFVRFYGDVCYICNRDNNNDRIFDTSGAVFIKPLSRSPRKFDDIVSEIADAFIDVDKQILEKDIIEFYSILEKDRFIISGIDETELNKKDTKFSYSEVDPKTIKSDFRPLEQRSYVTTKDFMKDFFKNKLYISSLQIEITSLCNERCIHCYIPHADKTTNMDYSVLFDVLDQFRDMGGLNLIISGGEPMAHPRFVDIITRLQEYDFSLQIFSNLTLVNDTVIKVLKDARLLNVQVSLYSMDPDIHDSITKLPGSLEKTKKSILRFIENDIPLNVSCPTMGKNWNGYADVINWSQAHKIYAHTDDGLFARYDHSTDNLDSRLGLNEVESIIKTSLEYDDIYSGRVLRDEGGFIRGKKIDRSNDIICPIGQTSLCMSPDGDVFPCPAWHDYVVGNIHNETLVEIWNNSPRLQYLRSLRRKDLPQKCQTCDDSEFCVFCLNRNANENPENDPFKINDRFCKVAALNKKIVSDWRQNKLSGAAQ
jgi:radical SAM protein with 4Fe4S-binding SPASM domain